LYYLSDRKPLRKVFVTICYIFVCSVDRASRYNLAKNNQLDAQLILSIFRQPLHVSGVPRPIIRRYNHMYTKIGTYCSFWMTVCCPVCIGQSPKKNSSTNCCIHTIVPPVYCPGSNRTRTTDSHLKRIIIPIGVYIGRTSCLLSWFQYNQDNRQSFKKNKSTNCFIHTVVLPDDGPRYARNM
jgi:hypothetical protein